MHFIAVNTSVAMYSVPVRVYIYFYVHVVSMSVAVQTVVVHLASGAHTLVDRTVLGQLV